MSTLFWTTPPYLKRFRRACPGASDNWLATRHLKGWQHSVRAGPGGCIAFARNELAADSSNSKPRATPFTRLLHERPML